MISEEKIVHLVHIVMDGLESGGLVSIPDKQKAIRQVRRAGIEFLSGLEACADLARKRILSQKSPPPEYSKQWETLYEKYYDEEMRKRGG